MKYYRILANLFFINIVAHYQDIIINNTFLTHGSFECASRYDLISNFLTNYKRPFSVLDIGASEGYFSFKIAHDYPGSSCIMIEGNYGPNSQEEIADRLEELCKENTDLDNIILLKKYFTHKDLQTLSENEHFDVTLALNIIHHFGSNWKAAADAILNMGDYIIIETPSPQNTNVGNSALLKEIYDYLICKNGKLLGYVPTNRPTDRADLLFLFEIKKSYVHIADKKHELESDFSKKILNNSTVYMPGIHYQTFKLFNGTFPPLNNLCQNLIIQGQNIIYLNI